MHGVQPTAKIAPSVNAVPRPARPPTRRLPILPPTSPPPAGASVMPPVIVVRPAEAPASSGRHVRSRTGMRRMPGEAQAHDHEDDPADDPQRGQVVGEDAPRERRGDAEQREHRPEPGHVRHGMPDGSPARRRLGAALGGDCDGRELAQVGRHERQHAW